MYAAGRRCESSFARTVEPVTSESALAQDHEGSVVPTDGDTKDVAKGADKDEEGERVACEARRKGCEHCRPERSAKRRMEARRAQAYRGIQ